MQVLTRNFKAPSVELNPTKHALSWKYKPASKIFPSSAISVTSKSSLLNNRILALLDEFSCLENNWDNDEGLAPLSSVISKAKGVVESLSQKGQKIFHAAPGPNGEIMIDIRNNTQSKSLEIIFYPLRSVAVLYSDDEAATQREFIFEDLAELLNWLNVK